MKKVMSLLLALTLCMGLCIPAFATEEIGRKVFDGPIPEEINGEDFSGRISNVIVISRDENGNLCFSDASSKEARIDFPNLGYIYFVDMSNDRWRLVIKNVGVDKLDLIHISVKAYNAYNIQFAHEYSETLVLPNKSIIYDYYTNGWTYLLGTDVYAYDKGIRYPWHDIDKERS